GISRERSEVEEAPPVDADPFLAPVLTEDTVDLFLVRTRILEEVTRFVSGVSGTLLDVGCGQMPYRSLVHKNPDIERYLGMDIENETYHENVRPDIIWDGVTIPLE